MSRSPPPDLWHRFAGLTPARIALGRAGSGLPTRALLDFDVARALARDAVHQAVDFAALAARWSAAGGGAPVQVASRAPDRVTYLQRPDLGRRLDPASAAVLGAVGGPWDLALVVADGLSAPAVERHALAVIHALLPALEGWRVAPLVLARQGRVALGDEIGAGLGAALVLVLLGERPGLTAPDSLGAYLTYGPRVGRQDAERNCVANIHGGGLTPAAAAGRLAWLIAAARTRGLTGVALRDESPSLPAAEGGVLP